MNRKIIIAGVALLVGVAVWFLFYFSDQQVIKRKFASIAVSLSKDGEETPVMIALKMRPVKGFLAPTCEVAVPERNYREILEPGLVTQYLIAYRSRQANLRVALDEILIETPNKEQAEVRVLVRVTANHNQPGFFDETHWVRFSLHKREKNWLLHKAILPDALVRS